MVCGIFRPAVRQVPTEIPDAHSALGVSIDRHFVSVIIWCVDFPTVLLKRTKRIAHPIHITLGINRGRCFFFRVIIRFVAFCGGSFETPIKEIAGCHLASGVSFGRHFSELLLDIWNLPMVRFKRSERIITIAHITLGDRQRQGFPAIVIVRYVPFFGWSFATPRK